ncbi:sugar-binding protein, partial [filamentous cyanobacterium CCP4]
FYLGLWWRNYSVRHRREFEPACQQACRYFEQAVQTFDEAQRPELAARYINYWAEALHRLEAWDALETVATRAMALHQAQANPIRQARAEGFLAEVDLARENHSAAQRHAEAALALIQPFADGSAAASTADRDFYAWVNSFHRSWYLFSLGKAQMGQGQVDAAVQTLEQVQRITQPEYDPQLYSQMLEYLRQGYFEQGHYLQAFETRRQKEAIESRFNFRAFVGAGRLQPKQQITNPALPTGGHGPDLIMASGRRQDVQRLMTRLEQDEFVLTVVYGPSGVGKSSILYAGLMPALSKSFPEGRSTLPVLVRGYRDWPDEVNQALARALQQQSDGDGIPPAAPIDPDDLTQRLKTLTEQSYRQIVLIFDQFEEFFVEAVELFQRRDFYAFLRDCLNTPYLKVVLSLREDYLHYLLEIERGFDLDIINNDILSRDYRYYLGNFKATDAKFLIRRLTDDAHFYLETALIDRLVADLANAIGEVRPIELQVVGAQLQRQDISTLAEYLALGNHPKETLVQNFLGTVVHDCGPENADLARLVLYLLTDIDRENRPYRPQKSREDLEEELDLRGASYQEDQLDLVLDILVGSGLVFLLPDIPIDRYQLVHDYLVSYARREAPAHLLEKRNRRRGAEGG